MTRKKPSLKHLHAFGSKCFVLKDNSEYVGKFDAKAFDKIFLGYSLDKTAFKVYVKDQQKVMESTDVTFDDQSYPGLEEDDENENNLLRFENQSYLEGSDDEDESYVQATHNAEGNFTNSSESVVQTPVIGCTNTGGVSELNDHVKAETRQGNEQGHTRKWDRDHTVDQIIGNPSGGVRTRRTTINNCLYGCFLSQEEPKVIEEALKHSDWIVAMQEELNQFEKNNVWELVPPPGDKNIIETK